MTQRGIRLLSKEKLQAGLWCRKRKLTQRDRPQHKRYCCRRKDSGLFFFLPRNIRNYCRILTKDAMITCAYWDHSDSLSGPVGGDGGWHEHAAHTSIQSGGTEVACQNSTTWNLEEMTQKLNFLLLFFQQLQRVKKPHWMVLIAHPGSLGDDPWDKALSLPLACAQYGTCSLAHLFSLSILALIL